MKGPRDSTTTNHAANERPLRSGAGALLLALTGLAGCAGAAAPKSAAEAPAQAQQPAPGSYPASMPLPSAPQSSADHPAAGAAAPAAPTATVPRREGLRRDIEAAQRELDLSGADCASACRALGSMERATARLCTLEEASCEDVRVRLRKARERVRATCGGCGGAPSVDPDAPIPSR